MGVIEKRQSISCYVLSFAPRPSWIGIDLHGGMRLFLKGIAGCFLLLSAWQRHAIYPHESPGGRIGGLLLVQHKKTKYRERADGSPILPVFTMSKPDQADVARMKQFAETKPVFELEVENIPVFEVRKSMLEGASALDKMMHR